MVPSRTPCPYNKPNNSSWTVLVRRDKGRCVANVGALCLSWVVCFPREDKHKAPAFPHIRPLSLLYRCAIVEVVMITGILPGRKNFECKGDPGGRPKRQNRKAQLFCVFRKYYGRCRQQYSFFQRVSDSRVGHYYRHMGSDPVLHEEANHQQVLEICAYFHSGCGRAAGAAWYLAGATESEAWLRYGSVLPALCVWRDCSPGDSGGCHLRDRGKTSPARSAYF